MDGPIGPTARSARMLKMVPVSSPAVQFAVLAAGAPVRAVRSGGQAVPDSGVDATRRTANRRPGRIAVGLLLAIATLALLVGSFALWVERQALHTDNWTKTSSQMLANPKIQKAVSAYLVSELFSSVNVAGELRSLLPDQVAAPAAAELERSANRLAPKILAKPSVQDAWRNANLAAHSELLRILEGGGRAVSTRGGVVTLNLHPLVDQLAKALGSESLVAALPSELRAALGGEIQAVTQRLLGIVASPQSGQLVIMRSNQLQTAQNIVEGIRGLAIVLPLAALAMFALAVWLARGWRRVVVRRIGWCFIVVGVGVLVARRLIEPRVVDSLVSSPSARPAADVAWSIGTSLLRDIALASIAYGAVIVAAAWLAGGTRPARVLRELMAFNLREHPGFAFGALVATLLLLVLWGPTAALRQLIPVLGITALLVLGLEVIRRQTKREFPQAEAGEAGRMLRRWAAAGRPGHHDG